MDFIEQLKAYCTCTDIADKDVNELVTLISIATCWVSDVKAVNFISGKQDNLCDTFFSGDRREVIDLPSCADCPIEFAPFYYPFKVDSFKFYLVKQDGIQEDIIEITDFAYHVSDGKFHINTGLPKCKCTCDPCGCPPKYKLVVEYVAGYEEIPDCLLPVFCDLIDMIRAKNDCECKECACDNGYKEEEYAQGDTMTQMLRDSLSMVLVEQYKNMIGMISLCRDEEVLWGAVV